MFRTHFKRMYIISIVSSFAMDDTNFGIKSQTPPTLCGVQSYFVFIVVPCPTHVSIAILVTYTETLICQKRVLFDKL